MTSPVSELHEPLADGHIRLLELNFEHEHDIVGHLRTVKLTSAPAYYALSYVCGIGLYEHEVTINNALFKVKPNLHAALRRLQSYFRSAGTFRVLIWIDAICIDQHNTDEKAKQIQGMHGIFSKAETVLIALDPVPENVHLVLSVYSWIEIYTALDPLIRSEVLERVDETKQYDHREAWLDHSDLPLARDIERLEYVTQQLETRHKVNVQSLLAIKILLERLKLFGVWTSWDGMSSIDIEEKLKPAIDLPGLTGQLFHPNHQFWAGVYALSEIKWHRRVWTYQEIVLARHAEVLAEGLSVDWSCVVRPTIGLLLAMESDTLFEKIDAKASIVGLPTYYDRAIWSSRWKKVGGSGIAAESIGLISALIITRNRKSTVAKDKVYGLLAVLSSDVRAQIPIDYATADGEVLACAVKAGLKETPGAKISDLWELFDGNLSAMEDFPSWCPDLASVSGPVNPANHRAVPYAVRQQTSVFASYEHSPGFQTIRAKVLVLDIIAGCLDVACPLDNTGSQFSPPSDRRASRILEAALKRWLVQLRAAFSDDGSAPGLTREVVRYLHGTAEHSSLLPFESFWETLNHMLSSFTDSDMKPLRVYDCLKDSTEYRHTLTIISSQSGRYLFKTVVHETIGFTTSQQTPGNHVVILPGSMQMHMLTRDCTQYSGIVSLPGVSEDELLDFVNARENMWEMVELR
jgi:hypothetical protein